jgi:hypothetical protein
VDVCLESLGPEDLVMHMVSPRTVTNATCLTNILYNIDRPLRCEFDLLFYNSQSQANWSRKNGQALPAVHGEISNTEI